MAKRGYKLQEFVAHTANVNCLSMGKKTCRLLITGGDDSKVNVWAIGKPTSLMSLCGHTSPVESLAFNSAEVLVLVGSSTGGVKLWDLEETKMVRGLTAHKSNCTALEFHPFGEFFASGSVDTNLNVWDIRKKGCIHTYKGHTRGVSMIRFTPDGRWVVSGGFDNVVKIWDLTAGKLVNEFKFHEGPIRTIDFHPLEFLLATGSADRTVKFWDLETFELIGSTRPEATGVRSVAFHPDGRTLFSGADDGLKIYSWEPVVCHDSVDIGWSALGDLCINEGKLLGCSYYRNSVGVWAADIAHIEPYGRNDQTEKKFNLERSYSSMKAGSGMRSTLGSRPLSPDCETKEIKNIYIDTAGSNPITTNKDSPPNSPKMFNSMDACEISNPEAEKQSPGTEVNAKSNGQSGNKSFITPSVVPRDNSVAKDSSNPAKESITFSRTKPGMLLRPAHVRRPSVNKFEVEKLSVTVEPGALSKIKSWLDSEVDMNSQAKLVSEDEARKHCDEKGSNIKSVVEKSEKVLSPQTPPNQETCNESLACIKDSNPVKIVRGVAVVPGRTRTLVEKFERREGLNNSDDPVTNTPPPAVPESDRTPDIMKGEKQISETKSVSSNDVNRGGSQISRTESTSGCEGSITGIQIFRRESTPTSDALITGDQISRGESTSTPDRIITGNQTSRKESTITPERVITPTSVALISGDQISRGELTSTPDRIVTGNQTSRKESTVTPERIITPTSDGLISGDQISRGELTSTPDRIVTGNQTSRKESIVTPERTITPTSDGLISGDQISRGDLTSTTDRIGTGDQTSRKGSTITPERIIIRNQISRKESNSASSGIITGNRISRVKSASSFDRFSTRNQRTRRESTSVADGIISRNQLSRREVTSSNDRSGPDGTITERQISRRGPSSANDGYVTIIESQNSRNHFSRRESTSANGRGGPNGTITDSQISTRAMSAAANDGDVTITESQISRGHFPRREATSPNDRRGPNGTITESQISRRALSSANDGNVTIIENQISKGTSISPDDGNLSESLMQMHDIFLSTLRSRLTKVQVVRHFWEKNDTKGAIGALRKLPDHSVHADVISVLMEKMEILTLDLFFGLLPLLMSLLDSKTERHVNVSLEMLLKLVAVFGTMIRSTVSAPRGVGVDLHAEQRRECCNQCYMQLQKIQKLLPLLTRRGGAIARCANELNLALQE